MDFGKNAILRGPTVQSIKKTKICPNIGKINWQIWNRYFFKRKIDSVFTKPIEFFIIIIFLIKLIVFITLNIPWVEIIHYEAEEMVSRAIKEI